MSGIQIKIVIDTNIIFMAWHNPLGKCAQVLRKSREGKLKLFSPISVKEEITRLFHDEGLRDEKIEEFLEDFSIYWVERELYEHFLEETTVKHKADKPLEAVALLLNCDILSADEHFKNVKQKINIDELLKNLEIENQWREIQKFEKRNIDSEDEVDEDNNKDNSKEK